MSTPAVEPAPEGDHLTALALRAAGGDEAALRELGNHPDFHKYVEIICRKLWRTYQPQNNAFCLEDLIQQTRLQAIEFIGQFKGGMFTAWLKQIARHIHFADYGKKKREDRVARELDWMPPFDFSDDDPEWNAALEEFVRRLSPLDREILRLSCEVKDAMEIAEHLCSAEEWQALSEHDRNKRRRKVYKRLVKIQKAMVAALWNKRPPPPPPPRDRDDER
ncbi:MAG TPA: sigma-70 family RNA polymerase sigma factor [Pyrinomonadaceae bacterium]|jgi:DNA-directed RNA polymerase specialized sigma24 family protein|nr:sigma-70 family RNA polymerase sigma factor [Pyrinomonadaceae bacterium]